MKAKHIILLSCLSIFLLFACETTEKIDDFPLRPSQLVVNCFFTEGNIWEFQVSKSLSVLDNADLKLIKDATVKLYKGSELLDTITEDQTDGWYRTEMPLPEPGVEYSIEVSSPAFAKTLYAKDMIPEVVKISNVRAVLTDANYYEGYGYDGTTYYGGNTEGNFNVLFSDPGGKDNYYKISVFYIDTMYQSPDSLEFIVNRNPVMISSDDGAVDENGQTNSGILFTDAVFNGQDYELKVNYSDWNARRGRKYFIELFSLSRTGYFYALSINEFNSARNDPFAEPVQVFCNIENGYGIFAGYSMDVYEIVVDE